MLGRAGCSLTGLTNTIGRLNIYLGYGADATANNLSKATAIGYNAKVGASSSTVLGGTGVDAVKVGIGTSTPAQELDVAGNVQFSKALIPAGNAGTSGQVLTSAGAGVAPTWTSASATVIQGTVNLATVAIPTTSVQVYQGSFIVLQPGTWIVRPYGFFSTNSSATAVAWWLSTSSTIFNQVPGSGIASGPISLNPAICYDNAEFKSITVAVATTYYLWGYVNGSTGSMTMNTNERG